MTLQKYFRFLFVTSILLNFVIADNFKQFVDLKENSNDIIADNGVIPDDESSNNITYICGTNIKNDCECKNDRINCFFWFKDANVKPFNKNMEIKEVTFRMNNITVLRRGKIFPDNEDTVEKLWFRFAGVKYIEPGAFDAFISLRFLALTDNALTSIDETILTPQLGLTRLYLTLSNNNFTAINPMIFKNLKKLDGLTLSSNPNLKEFTNIFPVLPDLDMLGLDYCGIKFLEENVFKNLPKLRILLLEGNNLSTIPATIKYLPNLYQIELGYNLLTKIESNAFVSNPKLVYVILHSNSFLLSVDDCAFCGLPILEWVRLNSCPKLSYIHENAFGSISTGIAPSVEDFYINECNITILPEKLLDWKNAKRLNIAGNPYVCNCSMAWLFRDLLSEASIYDKKIKRRYHGHKYVLGCFPPLDVAHKHFFKPININEILEPCQMKSSSSKIFWAILLMAVLMGIAATVIYVYHQQINSIFVLHFTRFRKI